jgi:hypothetical protein
MSKNNEILNPNPEQSPFEKIKKINDYGQEFWSARELARLIEYTDYRNFVKVIEKARQACFNSGQEVSDHFVEVNEMVQIGSGAIREMKSFDNSKCRSFKRNCGFRTNLFCSSDKNTGTFGS